MEIAVILGDQLDHASPVLHGGNLVWMAEASGESTHVPSHKARIALFLSAMRHFRDELLVRGREVLYHEQASGELATLLAADVARLRPSRVSVVQPGDFRVLESLRQAIPDIEVVEDPHFYESPDFFRSWASGRKQLRLEYFYRELRRRHNVLMDGPQPAGGAWNFDASNREAFPRSGPGPLPAPVRFDPDPLTRDVLAFVEQQYAHHPGRLEHFDWPVTRAQALAALDDFIQHRLPHFGLHQDAMWTGEPWLYHSRLSAALNLKLLNPREAVAAAERAWREERVPIAAAEGFIRQILGWREYVRGIYWTFMPGYAEGNALNAHAPLPGFYWTGDTDMNCLREAIGQTLEFGYAHHIQRLMVTGLYALLTGVEPRQIHEWYLSMYVDAVEWVELPNTIGMSQFADGGLMASKPYCATGNYLNRMSNYCSGCRYDPASDCPFTIAYWDFLERNEPVLRRVPRMELQLRNLDRRKGIS
ncbi:MAG TPA: cryptochrome/photolyase family protein [Bryobacteraceae bacterium]|nr:cryptochrome/photolyase family protein [Bryobacteraceae bacterium]